MWNSKIASKYETNQQGYLLHYIHTYVNFYEFVMNLEKRQYFSG